MPDKPLYKTWIDPDGDFPINFIKINPDGTILQLSFSQDKYGDQVRVCKSSVNNFYVQGVFSSHKQTCSKTRWMKAEKQARLLIKEVNLELNNLIQ